ncbi:MAG: N-acetylmuramoyl-L-alanine amidase [Lachnospiraceae bacterium]|jgi:N-acetylmuramoyl-L-alanine amidase|nr:N-acetylmuramoyl-L-alanine amidase [Lachnospiraceae bacterium]
MKIIKKIYQWAYAPARRTASDIKYIILHHAAAESCTADDIHRWHLKNGWAGMGYNYFIAKDGTIYTGRDELQCGAHTEDYNTSGMGICCEGNYMVETMPAAQKAALIELIKDIRKRYGNLPIKGHRDLNATSCPGDNFPMAEIIAAVEGQAGAKPGQTGTKPEQEANKTNQEVCEVKVRVLGMGDDGKAVRALQRLLISEGYNCGGFGADGVFGAGTERSVRAYQGAHGLAVDGIVGAKTWGCLLGC